MFFFVVTTLKKGRYSSILKTTTIFIEGDFYGKQLVWKKKRFSDPTFVNMNSVDKKRLLISKEKIKETRQVELSCLKNRFGPIFESCKLNYIPNADLFIGATKAEQNKKSVKVL